MRKRKFWKVRYEELKNKCEGIALIGRHNLIVRGFSAQNGNITKGRTSIQTPLLRDLLMIILEGPDIGTEDFYKVMIRALRLWTITERRY